MGLHNECEYETQSAFCTTFYEEDGLGKQLQRLGMINRVQLNFNISFLFVVFPTLENAQEVLNSFQEHDWKIDNISFQRTSRVHPSKLKFTVTNDTNSFFNFDREHFLLHVIFLDEEHWQIFSWEMFPRIHYIPHFSDIHDLYFEENCIFYLDTDAFKYLPPLLGYLYRWSHPLYQSTQKQQNSISLPPIKERQHAINFKQNKIQNILGIMPVLLNWACPENIARAIALASETKCHCIFHLTNHPDILYKRSKVLEKIHRFSRGVTINSKIIFPENEVEMLEIWNELEEAEDRPFHIIVMKDEMFINFVRDLEKIPIILMETFFHEKIETKELYNLKPPEIYFGVVGSERNGISPSLLYRFLTETSSEVVYITTSNLMPSLNAFSATCLLIFHHILTFQSTGLLKSHVDTN